MRGEPAYIIKMNIERYRSLLQHSDTTGERRKMIERLLAEAEADLASVGPSEPDKRP